MLFQVLDYIRHEKMVNIDHLTRLFRIDRQALEPLLSRLVTKNLIQAHRPQPACGSACGGCVETGALYYTFIPTHNVIPSAARDLLLPGGDPSPRSG